MPTLIIPAGQLNVKGPQAPTGVDRWISDGTALTITGLALTLAIAISTPAGALTYTGQAIVNPLAQAAGVLQWAGLTPTVTISNNAVTIAVPAGTETFTGLVQTVRVGDVGIDIPAGQLVIKGPQRPQEVPKPPAGSLAFTGHVLVANNSTPGSALSIPVGSLVYTGRVLDLFNTKTIAVPVGTLNLSGTYVAIQFMQPSTGSVIWQGYAPSLDAQTISIAIPRGRLIWGQTALVPSLQYDFTQAIPVGQLALTGYQINVGTPETLVLQAGSLALTGQAPTVDWSTAIPVGALTFTGHVQVLDVATGSPPIPVGQVVWQGYGFELIHSNGAVLSSTVQIVRSLSSTVRITRTLSSEVQR